MRKLQYALYRIAHISVNVKKTEFFERFANYVTVWTGSTFGFTCALAVVLTWLVTGPAFGFSDTWQLVINTSTTIVTFLMLFLVQRSQNKEILALHVKLNELIKALPAARNALISVETLPERAVKELHDKFTEGRR
jgi:low affinity Fe/Cu permease